MQTCILRNPLFYWFRKPVPWTRTTRGTRGRKEWSDLPDITLQAESRTRTGILDPSPHGLLLHLRLSKSHQYQRSIESSHHTQMQRCSWSRAFFSIQIVAFLKSTDQSKKWITTSELRMIGKSMYFQLPLTGDIKIVSFHLQECPNLNPLAQHTYLSAPYTRPKERCLWVLWFKHLVCIKMLSASHPSTWSLHPQLVISPPNANTDDLVAPPALSKVPRQLSYIAYWIALGTAAQTWTVLH